MEGREMIRKARAGEAEDIKKLIDYYARKNAMLPRSLSEIYENLRDYWVWEERKRIVGCAGLHVSWIDLGEIKSLAVARRFMGRGIGTALVKKCLEEAKDLGLKEIFVLTFNPGFFKKSGFKNIAKEKLPGKIWSECVRCVKFPNCNEVALIYYLK
jgi:amino-acid N-acetyltransferase